MFVAGLAAVLVALFLMMARALLGPTAFDRLVVANSMGTAAVLLIALYGFLIGRPEFLDIALLYALMNAVVTFAALKFWRQGSLAGSGREGGKP